MAGKDDAADALMFFAKVIKWYGAKGDEKDKLVQELKEKTFPQKLDMLQKNVTNGHVNGSETLSWADFHCCCILDMLSQHFGINMADCPELKKVYDGVVAEPNIKKWLHGGEAKNRSLRHT